jgi:hypothetical protein
MRMARYQSQPWYIKLWRRRHQLMIPYVAFRIRCSGESWGYAWKIASGLADYHMNWLYTAEEVRDLLNSKGD